MAGSSKKESMVLKPLDAVREADTDAVDFGPSIRNRPVSLKYATFGKVERINGHAYSTTISLEDEQSPLPVSTNPPEYHSVPEVTKKQAPQYQEIPYSTRKGHTSPAEEAQPISLSTSQQSDTEVDQDLYRTSIPSSSSTIPLTESSPAPPIPAERKPRKKANPLYDTFGEVVTTKSSSTKKPPPSKDTCHTIPFRCIKHPLTLYVIFIFTILNFAALLLFFTGTVEQAVPVSRGKVVQPMVTGIPDYAELINIIKEQRDTIESLHTRVSRLELLLMTNSTENVTTLARVAKNTNQIEQLTNQVTALERNTSNQIRALKDDILVNGASITGFIQKADLLETDVTSLKSQFQTVGQDISSIRSKNINQDNEISRLDSRIDIVKQQVALDLANYNDSIYMDLEDISKMQGPPGVNGSRGADGSDLSGCKYTTFSDSSGFNRPVTIGTNHRPEEGFVFTGVTCATFGGTVANLVQDINEIGTLRCECEGESLAKPSQTRFCTMHYWECPEAA